MARHDPFGGWGRNFGSTNVVAGTSGDPLTAWSLGINNRVTAPCFLLGLWHCAAITWEVTDFAHVVTDLSDYKNKKKCDFSEIEKVL